MAKSADQDFEWYPTTRRMVEVVKKLTPNGDTHAEADEDPDRDP